MAASPIVTHRDYFLKYSLSVGEYGAILVALAFGGKKRPHGNKGFDIDTQVSGQPARVEVKSKLARTPGGKATVVKCNANNFEEGAMTHLAVVLVDPETGWVTEGWLLTRTAAERLRRLSTDSKYINANEVRRSADKQDITERLNASAARRV
ncbi:MAG TPA: hypothetical protein PLE19_06165 [Planctomycetota bacterium]|nr:hypothetical protein [Planctomycetota bacterium]HRR81551.1 hypothetical protein [Planctomycetota bacterium]HRT93402.1 hypothetical protein [Planctomycetota bacterium]